MKALFSFRYEVMAYVNTWKLTKSTDYNSPGLYEHELLTVYFIQTYFYIVPLKVSVNSASWHRHNCRTPAIRL